MAGNFQGPQLLPDTWKNLFYPPERSEYTYFADAAKYPLPWNNVQQAQRYLVKAAWAADAAMLAYGRYGQTPIPPDEFNGILSRAGLSQVDLIGDWNPGARGTQGFFAAGSNGQSAILSFRGTERDDPEDTETDAKLWLNIESGNGEPGSSEPGKDVPTTASSATSLMDRVVKGTGDFLFRTVRVHAGFQNALDQVWPKVEKLLSEFRSTHPQAEILFTGHSLGAALATLAVSRFRGDGASLYTIGSPRVGNQPFCDLVRQQTGGRIFRFVNHDDLVTHMPIEAPFYRHVEEQGHLIDTAGEISLATQDALTDLKTFAELLRQTWSKSNFLNLSSHAPPPLVDHSPARYCMLLRHYLEHHVAPGV